MKTKPEDVSSTILLSSPQEMLHLLSSEKEYRGECRSESSSSEQKRKSQGGQTQVRDPGCTPCPLPQSCRYPATPGTQRGRDSSLGLHHTDYTAEQCGLQEFFRSNTAQQKLVSDTRTPHKDKDPHQSWNAGLCIYQSEKWGLRRIQSLNAQSRVLPVGCHGLFPRLMATTG